MYCFTFSAFECLLWHYSTTWKYMSLIALRIAGLSNSGQLPLRRPPHPIKMVSVPRRAEPATAHSLEKGLGAISQRALESPAAHRAENVAKYKQWVLGDRTNASPHYAKLKIFFQTFLYVPSTVSSKSFGIPPRSAGFSVSCERTLCHRSGKTPSA